MSISHRPFTRRSVLIGSATLAASLLPLASRAQAGPELRIGYQKAASVLVLQRAQGTLEKRLASQNVRVKWIEFPAGPQLLEGLNVGSIDVGYVGEAPPIFAQAAGAQFVYVGNDPASPEAEAIVVPKDSAIKTVADLKGKRIALNKGSNVHYLLVKLLEKSGLQYGDVSPVFLPPADARAAFERGSVDAWAIWDPFLSAAEKQIGARILANGKGVVDNHLFYLAARSFVDQHPQVLASLFEVLNERARWITANRDAAAAVIAPVQGLDVAIVQSALSRYPLGVRPVTPEVAAAQQRVADVFFDLKLIPKPVKVADALPARPITLATAK